MCTKFQTNQTILTLFYGVWDKNPTPTAGKVTKRRRQQGQCCQNIEMRKSPHTETLLICSICLQGHFKYACMHRQFWWHEAIVPINVTRTEERGGFLQIKVCRDAHVTHFSMT